MTNPLHKRSWFWIALASLLVIIGIVVWLFFSGRLLFPIRPLGPALPAGDVGGREAVSTEWITLFFSDARTGNLLPESREIVALGNQVERFRIIIEELLAGPNGRLIATLPATARINNVFMDKENDLYLDFSGEFVSDQLVGTSAEMAAVGSIMKTVAANLPDIARVQLLVDGMEVQTINGHLQADKPFLVSEWN
ncbi:GerMN domain-containing protein [candidate division KSB1 bacterium]